MGEICVGAYSQDRFHVLVVSGGRNVLEPVKAVGDVVKPSTLSKLAELDRRNPELGGVAGRDIAVLVECPIMKSSTIGIGQHVRLPDVVTTVPKTVRL
jgi:hypothetical protein